MMQEVLLPLQSNTNYINFNSADLHFIKCKSASTRITIKNNENCWQNQIAHKIIFQ